MTQKRPKNPANGGIFTYLNMRIFFSLTTISLGRTRTQGPTSTYGLDAS